MSTKPSQHEFSHDDNAVLSRLALKMRGVGFWFEVYGIVMLLSFAFKLWPKNGNTEIAPMDLLTGIVFLMLGHWTRRGGLGFRQVVDSEGDDMSHLMKAIRELSRFYTLIDRLILFAVTILLVAFGFGIAAALKRGL